MRDRLCSDTVGEVGEADAGETPHALSAAALIPDHSGVLEGWHGNMTPGL